MRSRWHISLICALSIAAFAACSDDQEASGTCSDGTPLDPVTGQCAQPSGGGSGGGGGGDGSDAGEGGDADSTGGGTDDAGDNTGADGGGEEPDATENPPPPIPDCGEVTLDTTFDVDPQGRAGQFYSRTAFDGSGVWVVYSRRRGPDDDREAIYATRLACDGSTDVAPILLSGEDSSDRHHSPAIAAGDDVVHIVWTSYESSATPKSALYMPLSRDGDPLLDAPANITPQGGLEQVSDLVWKLDVAALPNDEAFVVGTSGVFGALQIVGQRFGVDGELIGDAISPYTDKDMNNDEPTVGTDAAGNIHVAWTRSKDADAASGTAAIPPEVVFTTIPAGATSAADAPFPARPLSEPNPLGRFAKNPGPNGEQVLAFQITGDGRADIQIRDGADAGSSKYATFGSPMRYNFRPFVEVGEGGGLVTWFRGASGPSNLSVAMQPFSFDGSGGFNPGEVTIIPTDHNALPPYGPSVTYVGEGVYFISWSEGAHPSEARVKGRFVKP